MCKKMFFVFPAVVLLVLAGNVCAQLDWTDWSPDDNDFNNALNWDPNDQGPPEAGQGGITITGPMAGGRSWPTMWADVNTTVDSFGMSGWRTGATYQVADPCLVMWGRLVVEPGLIILGSGWPGGEDNTGTVHLMPGSYWRTQRDPTTSTVHGFWSTQMGGDSTVVLDGGEWVADGITLSFNTGGGGTLRINDGDVRTYFFEMLRGYDPWQIVGFYPDIWMTTCTSNLDIRDGSLIIDGDRRDSDIPYEKYQPYERGGYIDPYYDGREDIGIQGFIDRGWITAYGDPCDPGDPQHWYQPGNDDVNNWWMPKWGEVIVTYVPNGEMVKPDEPSQAGHTVVTAYLGAYGEPYGLYPRQNATGVLPTVTLSWGPGDYVAYGGEYLGTPDAKKGNGHHVFIREGSGYGDWSLGYPLNTAMGRIVGTQDANTFDISAVYPGGSLELDTKYAWTVIESNDLNAPAGDWWWKAPIHYFTTVGGKASNPNPKDGGVAGIKLGAALTYELTWDRGYYAASTNGHVVYFGANFNDVDTAVTGGTTRTDPNYTATGLELGKEYFWRVDEVNTAGPDPCIWPGDTWSFTVGDYRVIDDFDYASFDDMDDFWKINAYDLDYTLPCWPTGSGAWLDLDHGKMSYSYDNNDIENQYGVPIGFGYFSEVRYEFPTPADLTYGDDETTLRALSLDYAGNTDNAADPNYDRMYVALESADGNVLIVLNPDVSAQKKSSGQFNIDLRDFSSADVNVQGVVYLYVGFGIQCSPNTGTPGGEGVVNFDNIRVYPPRCVGHPGGVPYYGQLGDLNGDCTVDIKDMKLLSNAWLMTDRLTGTPLPVADDDPCMLARWEFEGNYQNDQYGTAGSLANGEPCGTGGVPPDVNIVPDDTRPQSLPGNKVVYFNQDVNEYIDCNAGWGDMNEKSFTLSVWEKQEDSCDWGYMVGKGQSPYKLQYGMTAYLRNEIHFATHGLGYVPDPQQVLDNGTWYHVAATWDEDEYAARVYINGRLGIERIYTDEEKPDHLYIEGNTGPNEPRVTMGANWDESDDPTGDPPRVPGKVIEYFKGYLDDVRIYDRRLSEEELMWLAGLPSTTTHYYAILPPAAYADTYSPEPKGQKKVNFKDMAKMAQEWLESADWPVIP